MFASALLACFIQAPVPAIAVTRSGIQIEATGCQIGDLELDTPFGRYSCATDPIIEVRNLLRSFSLLSTIREKGLLNNREWLSALSESGFLSALLIETELISHSFPELYVGYDLIESWAKKTSRLPASITLDKRLNWLHEIYLKKKGLQRLVYGTELVSIISGGSNKNSKRNLSYNQISDELQSSDHIRRRIGLQLCVKQSELIFMHQILSLSMIDPSSQVRQTAAKSAAMINQHTARQYWVKIAARGLSIHRSYAVDYLAHLAGPIGLRVIKILNSASTHFIGEQYTFDDIKIRVVKSSDLSLIGSLNWRSNNSAGNNASHGFDYLSDDTEIIESKSTFTITKVPSLLAEQIRALL
ncbi:MAG: hypothetical protein H8E25_07300 [Planctomycetes bacterium]|nr:hypothetical protein [Planctomycetota bacterium]